MGRDFRSVAKQAGKPLPVPAGPANRVPAGDARAGMSPRASLSRPPLERMLRIHEELRRDALINCTKLVKVFEVCRKTVVRDIAFMRDRLDLPIEFDPRIQAYRYTQPVNAFPTVQVTEGELLALLVARRALEQYRGTPFHRQLEIAFDKLAGGLKDRISFSPADELRSVSFRNIGLGKADLAVFNALSAAVLRQVEVEFEYRKPGERSASRRPSSPTIFPTGRISGIWWASTSVALRCERMPCRASRTSLRRRALLSGPKTSHRRSSSPVPWEFLAARATTRW